MLQDFSLGRRAEPATSGVGRLAGAGAILVVGGTQERVFAGHLPTEQIGLDVLAATD